MKIKCPCCQAENKKKVIYFKQECPALNNVVYKTKVEASNCSVGNVELVHCPECQFVYNCRYDGKLLKYDQDYNSVRNFSSTYRAYLDHLVKLCSIGIDKYKRVLEIGCGDGEFLKKFCTETGACGFGYDASYHGEENYKDNVVFHKERFIPSNKHDPFDAVFLRHILEHIPNPYYFLKEICKSDRILPGTKLWIEVPDFEWIVKNGVFYDITYEHCNYFTKPVLTNLLNKLGFTILSFKNVFDSQYLLVEAIFQQEEFTDQKIGTYSLSIQNIDRVFEENKKRFQKFVEEGVDLGKMKILPILYASREPNVPSRYLNESDIHNVMRPDKTLSNEKISKASRGLAILLNQYEDINFWLKRATANPDSFYGLLAAQILGCQNPEIFAKIEAPSLL